MTAKSFMNCSNDNHLTRNIYEMSKIFWWLNFLISVIFSNHFKSFKSFVFLTFFDVATNLWSDIINFKIILELKFNATIKKWWRLKNDVKRTNDSNNLKWLENITNIKKFNHQKVFDILQIFWIKWLSFEQFINDLAVNMLFIN